MQLSDINDDGECRLLVANADRTLKVYKGTTVVSEHALLDVPSAMATFYPDASKPRIPSVAVAAGSHIYIYRNMRPFYKFTTPPRYVHPVETEIWTKTSRGLLKPSDAQRLLAELRDSGIVVTVRTHAFLQARAIRDIEIMLEQFRHQPLTQPSCIACMEVIHKSLPDDKAVSCLVLGTENKEVIILEPSGNKVHARISLPGVPAFMAIQGQLDVDYRIVVACRNGSVYTIKKGRLLSTIVELESPPCGLVLLEKTFVVGCMDNTLRCFHFKGRKQYSIFFPAPITNMCLMELQKIKSTKVTLVALANGEVRVYNGRHLVHSIPAPPVKDVVTGMRFGSYGREAATLIMAHKSGAIVIKMLQRNADLDAMSGPIGPPPEQDIPLEIPKKTKLYVEQMEREREQAIDMHRMFQRDLCKLRLHTARTFVKLMYGGEAPLSSAGEAALKVDAKVQGLGPVFRVVLTLKNMGEEPEEGLAFTIIYNTEIYKLSASAGMVPLLLPGVPYEAEVTAECIDPTGAADALRITVCELDSVLPVMTAIVNMPPCEIVENV